MYRTVGGGSKAQRSLFVAIHSLLCSLEGYTPRPHRAAKPMIQAAKTSFSGFDSMFCPLRGTRQSRQPRSQPSPLASSSPAMRSLHTHLVRPKSRPLAAEQRLSSLRLSPLPQGARRWRGMELQCGKIFGADRSNHTGTCSITISSLVEGCPEGATWHGEWLHSPCWPLNAAGRANSARLIRAC